MKTILAPIDFSPVTEKVVDESLQLARVFEARLVLLHVVEPPSRARDALPAGKLSAELLLAAKQAAQAKLEEFKKSLLRRYPRVEVLRLTGDPVDCVLDEAKKLPAAYLVIGSHGHGAVFDLLVGSVAHSVLMKAPCPVLIVSAPKATVEKARAAESAAAMA